jgi:hypothetical protein
MQTGHRKRLCEEAIYVAEALFDVVFAQQTDPAFQLGFNITL